MQNLEDLVKRYTVKQDRTIKKICNPLKDFLGITTFTYSFIESDGRFGMLSNNAQGLDFFINGKLFITHPYLKHPRLLRSGYALLPSSPDPISQEIGLKKFQVNDLFYMIQHKGESLEGFAFGIPKLDCMNNANFYFANLDLLHTFVSYFRNEAKHMIEDIRNDGFNLKQAQGKLFLESHRAWPLSSKDLKEKHFLKAISPLSIRERQCLELYKQGHSSQATAAILTLSQRTVEHYFENIKNKLGCSSKRDLLGF